MEYDVHDYNGATEYFAAAGSTRWAELERIIGGTRIQLQPSDQAGKVGKPIFDPKATNAALTLAAANRGWHKVPVPTALQPFGSDWDSGKGEVLAEWQFSNYPFLWNNIIRSEAVFQSGAVLNPLTAAVQALVIVTKSGSFPASNSTLYFEQAHAQIDTVTKLGVFGVPIRLVGLRIPKFANLVTVDWNVYAARYSRVATTSERDFIVRSGRRGQYGNSALTFEAP